MCLCFYIDDLDPGGTIKGKNEDAPTLSMASPKLEELAALGSVMRTGQLKALPSVPAVVQPALLAIREELLTLSGTNTGWFSHFLNDSEDYLVKSSRPTDFVAEETDGTLNLQSYIAWREADS